MTNHAPVPLLALWLEAPPSEIANLQVTKIAYGTFVDPANAEVQKEYILDPNDPHQPVAVPSGFTADTPQPLVANPPAVRECGGRVGAHPRRLLHSHAMGAGHPCPPKGPTTNHER